MKRTLILLSILALVVVLGFAACETAPDPEPEELDFVDEPYEAGEITFTYEGEADQVLLAGAFNNWQEAASPENEMEEVEENKFEITVWLDPGSWEYKYIIDGEWTQPQDYMEKISPLPNDETGDGFGGYNAVIEVQ